MKVRNSRRFNGAIMYEPRNREQVLVIKDTHFLILSLRVGGSLKPPFFRGGQTVSRWKNESGI